MNIGRVTGNVAGEFDTLAQMQAATPKIGTYVILRERGSAEYLVSAVGTALQPGDITFNNNTVGVLQVSGETNALWFETAQDAIDRSGSFSTVVFPSNRYVLSSVLKQDGSNSDLTNVSIVGYGDGSELYLDDNIQRQNVVETTQGEGFECLNMKITHNADRGGFFSRHAPTSGLTSNSGLFVNGTVAIGGTTISFDATTVIGKYGEGDTFQVSGDATIYTVTNLVTAAANQLNGIQFTPSLAAEATDGLSVSVYQLPRYKVQDNYLSGVSTLTLEGLNIQQNSAPFPATATRVGEQFQFLVRQAGTINQYVVDPLHQTVYTITNEVLMTNGGAGQEFIDVTISPALTQNVNEDTYITSIQDANNRYSNGIYYSNSDDVCVHNVTVDQAVWHGVLLGTGPRQAPGVSNGGDVANVASSRILNYGGNGIALGDMTRCIIDANHVDTNTTGVGNGIFPDSGCEKSIISNNNIKDAFYGIISFACDELTISGNSVQGCNIGVILDQNSDSNNVTGNTILGDVNSIAGVYLRKGDILNSYPFTNTAVVGNVISGIESGDGILVQFQGTVINPSIADDNSFISISGNTISSVSGYGISTNSMRSSSITGNVVSYSGLDGIYVNDASRVNVSSNNVSNAGIVSNSAGIKIQDADNVNIVGNVSQFIPLTTQNMDYGLEYAGTVTDDYVHANSLTGNVSGTSVNILDFKKTITADAILDFPNIGAGQAAVLTATVTGAEQFDNANVSQPSLGTGGLIFTAFVSAVDTATVQYYTIAVVIVRF